MKAITDLERNLSKIDINAMLEGLFSTTKYEKLLPDMVKERLSEKGTYSTGKPIVTYSATAGNVYSNLTIDIKRMLGQPTNRVTLEDTGAFYKSFKLVAHETFAVIEYNEIKPDGKVSDNVDLDNVFNLSEAQLKLLRDEVVPDLIGLLKNAFNA